MKWLEKLDAWLIAHPYQGLVDLSGKPRSWWVEQCAMAVLVGGVAYSAMQLLNPKVPAWIVALQGFCALLLAVVLFVDAKVPALMEQTGQRHDIRRIVLLMNGITAVVEVFTPTSSTLAWLVLALGTVSGLYFAACQPPRPREPRRKLATSGSAS